jgi:hypothetical protein
MGFIVESFNRKGKLTRVETRKREGGVLRNFANGGTLTVHHVQRENGEVSSTYVIAIPASDFVAKDMRSGRTLEWSGIPLHALVLGPKSEVYIKSKDAPKGYSKGRSKAVIVRT